MLQVTAGRREAWRQIAAAIREAIRSGQFAPGEELLSAHEIAARYGVRVAAARHALEALAQEELIEVRQGRRSIVRGDRDPAGAAPGMAARWSS